MLLIKCDKCGRLIDKDGGGCSYCGYIFNKKKYMKFINKHNDCKSEKIINEDNDYKSEKKENIKKSTKVTELRDFTIRNGILYSYNGTADIVQIPEGVWFIESNAFHGHERKLKKIIFPSTISRVEKTLFLGFYLLQECVFNDGLEEIDNLAFYGCKSLKEVRLPKTLTGIGKSAFEGCTELRNVDFQEGLKYIDDFAFKGCYTLKEVRLPVSLKWVGKELFAGTTVDIYNYSKDVSIPQDELAGKKTRVVINGDYIAPYELAKKETMAVINSDYIDPFCEAMELGECLEKDYRIELLELLRSFGFQYFLHTTNFKNFVDIYKKGYLFPRKMLENQNIKFEDNANYEVIANTSDSVLRCNRFYYRPKTPTNYSAYYQYGQKRPVMLAFNETLLYKEGVMFSSGNARAHRSCRERSACSALNFAWSCVFHMKPYFDESVESRMLRQKYNISSEDLKRYQQAEFLCPGALSMDNVAKFYFRNQEDLEEARSIFGDDSRFVLKGEYFF